MVALEITFQNSLTFPWLKSNFPDQVNTACQTQKRFLASFYSHPVHSIIKTDKFSINVPSSLRKNIVEINDSKWSFQPLMTLNQPCEIISIFPDFSSNCQFSLAQNKILWLFPDLEENFFPDHFLPCGNCWFSFLSSPRNRASITYSLKFGIVNPILSPFCNRFVFSLHFEKSKFRILF